MAQICKNLNEIIIQNCYQDLPGLITLIDAQRNLKSVLFYGSKNKKGSKGTPCKNLGNALARKGNMINVLHLDSVSIIPPSFLTSLINLKDLSIFNVGNYGDTSEEIKEIKQYLIISEFPNLQYLDFGLPCFKELAMLILKTKGNILYVDVSINNKNAKDVGMLIKAIANNCPKIKGLSTHLELRDFINVKLLLLNCRYLGCIKFDSLEDSFVNFVNENDNTGDELLDILTKFSPNSLTDISISGCWKYSIEAFERFFDSCREKTLFYFEIIPSNINYITQDHIVIIRKFIEEGVIKSCRFPSN
ncbi:hypothetical protein C1645_778141 [Glomus cerebriforme]|uniref:F-box domain-containing protein n=1 Tax=Glomus cerebriforme TaxID=658196 RepID=A0A397SLP3_9GLOM|nr:hypothetical protein C1645_778141 [Glomus cerebriforme]